MFTLIVRVYLFFCVLVILVYFWVFWGGYGCQDGCQNNNSYAMENIANPNISKLYKDILYFRQFLQNKNILKNFCKKY